MDKDSIDKLLRELISLNRENNEILRSLNFDRRVSMFFWLIRMIIIAGVAYGAYQTAIPYLQTVNSTLDKVNSFTNPSYKASKTIFDTVREKIGK
jgi:hypothetical protein